MSRPVDFLTIDCPAKVNLALSVASPLDCGMHPIASWMVTTTFGDRLTIHRMPADRSSSAFSLAYAREAPRRLSIDWPLEKDLAYRAHALLQEKVGRPLYIKATLEKYIPTGAGLGGGSSNAAAMLVGLNQLFDLKLPAATLSQWSASLGSDIPFLVGALMGCPSAVVSGLGEVHEPSPRSEPLHLALIFPPLACPTGPVYQAFDKLCASARRTADIARVKALASAVRVLPSDPFNDLAQPACAVQPELAQLIKTCEGLIRQPVHVTGSGAALFAIAKDEDHARQIAITMTRDANLPCVATQTRV
jgi:4-diphosphocytidyl-2-C-methyl-D-erythritol kinase